MTPMIRQRERQASGGFCASCSGVSFSTVLRTPREKREQILDEYERGGIRGDGRGEVSDAGLVGAAAAQASGWGDRGQCLSRCVGWKRRRSRSRWEQPLPLDAGCVCKLAQGCGWKWPMGNRRPGLGRCCGRWWWCGVKFCRIGAGVRGAGARRYAARGSRDWRGWTLLASTIGGSAGRLLCRGAPDRKTEKISSQQADFFRRAMLLTVVDHFHGTMHPQPHAPCNRIRSRRPDSGRPIVSSMERAGGGISSHPAAPPCQKKPKKRDLEMLLPIV